MKKRTVLFFNSNLNEGQPINSRVRSFSEYFTFNRFDVTYDKKKVCDFLFYSMPPFRSMYIHLKYRGKVILDVRDGWSIAQETGYGGSVRKKPVKAFFTRIIERFIIRRSVLTIACTSGLVKHLEKISGKPVVFVANGLSDERIRLANSLKMSSKNKIKEKIKMC